MDTFKQPDEAFMREMIDSLPSAVLVVDDDVMIHFANRAALELLHAVQEEDVRKRGGEAIGCLHAKESQLGCGHSRSCSECVIRNCVYKSFRHQQTVRRRALLEVVQGDEVVPLPVMVSTSPLHFQESCFCLLVIEDVSRMLELQQLIPICSSCKKVRDDHNYWHQVEEYVAEHYGDVEFTHSLCPDCLKQKFPCYSSRRIFRSDAAGDDSECAIEESDN